MNYALMFISFLAFAISAYGTPVRYLNTGDMKIRALWGFQCAKETNIDLNLINTAIAHPLDPPNDPVYKQFLACSYKKQGYQSENGKMLYDNIKAFLSRFYNEDDLKVLDECKHITGITDGDTAYNSLVCIMRNINELKEKNLNDNTV